MRRVSGDQASAAALALFNHGQREAAQRGLLLVDTKYEFGVDSDGRILLVDEIHTPDSSRRAISLQAVMNRRVVQMIKCVLICSAGVLSLPT